MSRTERPEIEAIAVDPDQDVAGRTGAHLVSALQLAAPERGGRVVVPIPDHPCAGWLSPTGEALFRVHWGIP